VEALTSGIDGACAGGRQLDMTAATRLKTPVNAAATSDPRSAPLPMIRMPTDIPRRVGAVEARIITWRTYDGQISQGTVRIMHTITLAESTELPN
jgi:hypothetical protein